MGLLYGARRSLLKIKTPSLRDLYGLVGEYDFSVNASLYQDSALTTLAAPTTPIGGVVDLSRSGNIATQTTTAAKPTLTANAINGRQAASFDGGDYLTCDSLAASAGVSGSDKPFTVAAVVQFTSVAALRAIFSFGRATTNDTYHVFRITATPNWSFSSADDTDVGNVDSAGTPNTSPHIICCLFSGTTISILIDGITVINEAAHDVGTLTLDQATIGALRTYQNLIQLMLGTIGQLAVLNRRISTPEAMWATRLLGKKWGITTA